MQYVGNKWSPVRTNLTGIVYVGVATASQWSQLGKNCTTLYIPSKRGHHTATPSFGARSLIVPSSIQACICMPSMLPRFTPPESAMCVRHLSDLLLFPHEAIATLPVSTSQSLYNGLSSSAGATCCIYSFCHLQLMHLLPDPVSVHDVRSMGILESGRCFASQALSMILVNWRNSHDSVYAEEHLAAIRKPVIVAKTWFGKHTTTRQFLRNNTVRGLHNVLVFSTSWGLIRYCGNSDGLYIVQWYLEM